MDTIVDVLDWARLGFLVLYPVAVIYLYVSLAKDYLPTVRPPKPTHRSSRLSTDADTDEYNDLELLTLQEFRESILEQHVLEHQGSTEHDDNERQGHI